MVLLNTFWCKQELSSTRGFSENREGGGGSGKVVRGKWTKNVSNYQKYDKIYKDESCVSVQNILKSVHHDLMVHNVAILLWKMVERFSKHGDALTKASVSTNNLKL